MKNDGGSAFPSIWYSRDSMGEMTIRESCPGMTVRQFYKGQATQGIAIHLNVMAPNDSDIKYAVELACKIADALIAEDMLAAREGKDE